MREILFLAATGVFVTALLGVATCFILRARRISRNAWSALLGRLQRIDREKLAAVALDLLDDERWEETGFRQRQLEPEQIFDMIGGMNGLTALEENCDVLIDLATYVQNWYPEALLLAEDLRLNAREIKWHIGRLRGASQTGHLRDQFPMYAQRAVATYYLMTRSLLVLYEGVQLPEFAELQHAI
jgi:hypothetical protein